MQPDQPCTTFTSTAHIVLRKGTPKSLRAPMLLGSARHFFRPSVRGISYAFSLNSRPSADRQVIVESLSWTSRAWITSSQTDRSQPHKQSHPFPHVESYPVSMYSDELTEKKRLLDQMRKLTRQHPSMTAGALLDWYSERVKESRNRIPSGSGDSPAAVEWIMRYAARRQDIYTLRRLRPLAQFWSHQVLKDDALRAHVDGSHSLTYASLAIRLDNALFGIAAKQDNWRVMHSLVKDKLPRDRWTPYMCLALLRAKSTVALAQVPRISSCVSYDPVAGHQKDEQIKLELWNMFLSEFGHYLRTAQVSETDPNQKTVLLSPWIIAALMELYSRCGKPEQTWNLLHMYTTMLFRDTLPNQYRKSSRPFVLRNSASRLLSHRHIYIPGPKLLNAILRAYLGCQKPAMALEAFSELSSTPLPAALAIPGAASPIDTRLVLEPNNQSILLVMDAIRYQKTLNHEAICLMLSFLKQIDRTWGTWRARDEPLYHPMFLSLRPMQRLLDWCLQVEAYKLVRPILRFQQGLFRRELRWNISGNRSHLWLQVSNEFSLLQQWKATLDKLCSRRWVKHDQVDALYAMALRVAQYREEARGTKAIRILPRRRIIPKNVF